MSDEPIDGGGSDDEALRRRLRNAVPEPGPGYWPAIDETLADIEGDTDRSVVRLTDMSNHPNPSTRRRLVLAAAAAAIVIVGVVGVLISLGSDDTTDVATDNDQAQATTDGEPQPTTGDIDEATDDPPAAAETLCYRVEELPSGIVVRLQTDDTGTVSAATYFDSRGPGEASISVAEGTVLADGETLQMLEVPLGEGVVGTRLWQLNANGLFLGEGEPAALSVDCGDVAAELAAIDAAVAALPVDPIEEMRQRGELSGSNPAIAAGTYCFASDAEEHPSERFIRLIVADDGSVTAATSNSEQSSVRGVAAGSFSTPTEMVMNVERVIDSAPPSSSLEVWQVMPLTGELIHGPLMFTLDPIDCTEIDQMFTAAGQPWPADTPLSRLFGAGLVADDTGVSSIFADGTIELIDEPAVVAFAAAPSAVIVYQGADGDIRVQDTDGGTATLVEQPSDGSLRLLSVLRYPTADDVRIAYALRTTEGAQETERVALMSLADPSDVIDLAVTGGIEDGVRSISAADATLLVQIGFAGIVEHRVFTPAGEQEPTGLAAAPCQPSDAGGCAWDLHLTGDGEVVYFRRGPSGAEVVLADAQSGAEIATVAIDSEAITLDVVGRRVIVNRDAGSDDVGSPTLIDFGPTDPLVVDLPVTGNTTLLRD